ncbi:MAG TPA: DUF2007 domain-containing protein [Aquaticitalea sp.]|nr:DUF2007 domain-containing protein [Aquaticitalea sp.]HNU59887.1 DUF2007 domain-containing protein [Aquaticitalea sp.]
MKDKMKKVFSGASTVQAMGFKNALEEAGITFYELDKSDSAYSGLFDQIQIFVLDGDEKAALTILKSLKY